MPVIGTAQDECYQLVWSDEFDYEGAPDPEKWDYDLGGHGWGNGELQNYTNRRENSNVANGILTITALKEEYGSNSYTSARLITKNKGDWKYGKVEVMAKVPAGRGTWSAIWMLPTDWEYGGWPESGEIDIMEHVGYDATRIFGTVHTEAYNHSLGTQKGSSRIVSTAETEFHLYSIEWFQDRIEFYIDDIRYFTFNNENKTYKEWPFDKRFHLLLNIAIGGSWGGAQGIDNTIFPTSMEIDYVRVYQHYNNQEIQGEHIIEGSETGLIYTTNYFDSVNYQWTVPEGVEIVNGQGTNEIEVNWSDSSGTVFVSIESGQGCDPAIDSLYVVVPEMPQGDVYIVDDFETGIKSNWHNESPDITLTDSNGKMNVNYKVTTSTVFSFDFDKPINLENHGILKFPLKLNDDAINNPQISVSFEDYLGNRTLSNWLTFTPEKDGQYHYYSFDYRDLWGIVNPEVNGKAITKIVFTLNFGNSGFNLEEILIYRSNRDPNTPPNFAISHKEDDSYLVSWDDVVHASAYNLYESKNIDGTFVKIQSKIPSGANPTTLELKGNYYYKISAVNNFSESPLSGALKAKTITALPDQLTGKVKLYPNPVSNTDIVLELDIKLNIKEVYLRDLSGRIIPVISKEEPGRIVISTDNKIETGIYVISVLSNAGMINKKLIVN